YATGGSRTAIWSTQGNRHAELTHVTLSSAATTDLRPRPSASLPVLSPRDAVGPPPQPRDLLLPGPDLAHRIAVVQATVLHHVTNGVRVLDVLERILVEHLKVGQLPRLERSEVFLVSDRFRAEDRRDAKH